MGKTILLSLLCGVLASAQETKPAYSLERQPVSGGAELITLFGHLPDPAVGSRELDVPLVSLLRDTLGDTDPDNDRLREVWILTSTRPTPIQRAASALSFAWFRTGTKRHANRVPAPALDLASPARTVWTNLIANGLQATQFDPLGTAVRASTRSYRGNFSDYRKLQLFQALGALDGLEREETGTPLLGENDFRQLYSRLSLSDRTLGGFVSDQNLARFYDRDTARTEEMRGHNWELLRQRAELCGLYFDPLALPGDTPVAALLWVAREDLAQRAEYSFDRQFLNIANPWNDDRLKRWNGYTQIRYLDDENRAVSPGTAGARPVEMIPLAFYSLDHPRVPLLLADFRDNLRPKRRELFQQGTNAVVTGVLGITRFGNWSFFAAESVWTFVRGRHGAAVNRSARLRAYAGARAFISVDAKLDPKLKAELVSRLDHLALNPLDNDATMEIQVAREQYHALLQYAQSPTGLTARLERDREKELASYTRSRAARMFTGFGRLFWPSSRLNSETTDPALLAAVDSHRRLRRHERFLERLLDSSPRPEVVWDNQEIRQAIESLSVEANASPRIAQLLARVFARSGEPELRVACLRALQRLNVQEARNELQRLSEDPATGDSWRVLCLLYLQGGGEPVLAGAPGGQ